MNSLSNVLDELAKTLTGYQDALRDMTDNLRELDKGLAASITAIRSAAMISRAGETKGLN